MKKFNLLIMLMMFFITSAAALASGPDFYIEDIRPVTMSLEGYFPEDSYVDVYVDLVNYGDAGKMNVEMGLYKLTWMQEVGFMPLTFQPLSLVTETDNCVAGESNVNTKEVSLSRGETASVLFSVKVPAIGVSSEETYGLGVTTYLRCYTESNQDTGQTDNAAIKVRVRDFESNPHLARQDEVDILIREAGCPIDFRDSGSCAKYIQNGGGWHKYWCGTEIRNSVYEGACAIETWNRYGYNEDYTGYDESDNIYIQRDSVDENGNELLSNSVYDHDCAYYENHAAEYPGEAFKCWLTAKKKVIRRIFWIGGIVALLALFAFIYFKAKGSSTRITHVYQDVPRGRER
jgi:hypothetical protein